MNICAPFIRRPVMTTLLMVGLLLFGAVAYTHLPVSDLPNVDFPVILVTAALPGASPDTMASAVATPLERQFATIAGIDSMTSSSTLGQTQITIVFTLSRNIDAAAQDVNAAISQTLRQLPQDMPNPPSYQKVNPADQPILYLALTSPTLPLYTLDDYGETTMAQRISMVNGVAQVLVFGAQKYAVRAQLDPRALSARGIGIDEAVNAMVAGNVNLPTGVLWGAREAYTIQAWGQLTDAAAYEPLIVAYRNGAPVRLSDLGSVQDSVENNKIAAWFRTVGETRRRSVILAIQKQPGTNTVKVADDVKALLPHFRAVLPASVTLNILHDRSAPINDSVNDVQFTLVLTLGLVVLVIFLFLRNARATIIPSLALPMSIVGTFTTMYLLGYSLDNLSLMALTLSVGFVVDDAIVMLENIVRHAEMGKDRLTASLEGSREIGFTIVSMTVSLAAVFIPVLFMGGLVGRLFREFAVTIGAAVIVSGVISLTLTPMLASRFLGRTKTPKAEGPRETRYGILARMYGAVLTGALRLKFLILLISAAVLWGTYHMAVVIPKGFLPIEDHDLVFGYTEASQGISFDAMVAHQQAINEVLDREPNIESYISVAGGAGGFAGSNTGVFFMHLKPRRERAMGAEQIAESLRASLTHIPGIISYPQVPPTIQIGGRLTRSQYQYTLQSPDTEALYRWSSILEQKIRPIPGLEDVATDMQLKKPQVNLRINRDRASSLGVTAAEIEDALYSAYGSRQISTIYAPNNQYRVIVELLPKDQLDPAALERLYVRSSGGALVPLQSVADIDVGVGPYSINHTGQIPSVTLSFNLKPGASLGPAVAAVDAISRKTLPATITTSFSGTAQAFQSSLAGMGALLIFAVLVIYMVLGILYESFIHPITILTALPFAGFGALATLLFFGVDLSLYAFVGIIMLVGLVKKNGIMMVDFAIAARKEGLGPEEAIHRACMVRFRPIMMTTVAALMAGLPIAIGWGAGAEARRPLGLAVVGGLVFSQALTLFVTPVFYVYFERLQTWLGRRRGAEEVPVAPREA